MNKRSVVSTTNTPYSRGTMLIVELDDNQALFIDFRGVAEVGDVYEGLLDPADGWEVYES